MAAPKNINAPRRQGNGWLTAITIGLTLVVSVATGWLTPVAATVSHFIERTSNGIKARRELKARAKWYAPQIAQTLGIDPSRVTVADFKAAAQINPTLATALEDVKREESKENSTSMIANGAMVFIPGGHAVHAGVAGVKALSAAVTIGKQVGATVAGGLLLEWASKDHINGQEVIEGISAQLDAAHEQGIDPRKTVTPQMVFLLRVSQDELLGKEIEERFKKPFQKMNEAEQQAVMMEYKPLADAVTSEAYAVAKGILPVQELMARAPNLKGNAARYAIGGQNATFVGNETTRRLAAQQQQVALN